MNTIPIRKLSAQHAKQSASGAFSARSLAQVTNGENLVHHLHRHTFYLILAIDKGTGIHEIDFNSYEINGRSIFILRPGQVHRLELSGNSNGFLIEFDPEFYQPQSAIVYSRFKKATVKNYCKTTTAKYQLLHNLLADIYNEFTAAQPAHTDAIKAYLNLFFIAYLRQSDNSASTAAEGSNYRQQQFDELMALLEKNVTTGKTVVEYAQLLNLSPYQLNSITAQAVGKTVSQLIAEQLLLETKRYLLGTPLQIKDISATLGFDDVSYFVRFFKKHTGYTPEVFRKNFK